MKHFVILLDSRPQFVGRGAASLLQIPVGGGSLLAHFSRAADEGLGSCEIFVLPVSPMGRGYAEAIERAAGGIHVIDSLRAVVDRAEPSDVLAVIDSRRALLESYPWKELTRAAVAARGAAHLVATDDGPERAQENTWHDETGEIQCVQRYYAGVTLVRAQTVFCTLMSGAAARLAADEPLSSARQLRQTLAAADVASRDVLTVTPWVEMDQERGALSFACRRLLTPETTSVAGAQNAERAVHKAARLIGPVEIDSGAVVEAGSTIIGPVILGAGSHVLRGATVARAVIGPGVTVPAGSAVAQRVVLANENLRDEMDDEEDGSTLQSGSLRRAYASIPAGAGHRTRSRSREVYAEIKALVEAIIAIVALVMLAPLFVLTAIAIKCDSAGPVFFGHGREGRGGKRFKCWKFRTMVPDADARQRALYRDNPIDGPQFKLKTDPRVTRVGRVLRETNIDELPQLFNVLLRQMSLIGPRPSPFRENQVCVEWREARLSVRPGITGLWQVCRSNRDSSDFHQWISYDIAYVRHMSPLLDLRIIIATILTLGGRKAVSLDRIIPGYHDQFVTPPRLVDVPILTTWPDVREAACR